MKRLVYILPLVALLVLGVFSIMQLNRVGSGASVNVLPSVLIDRVVPPLALPAIAGYDRGWGTEDLLGQVTIVNIFGSWCIACQVEHPVLVDIQENYKVPIFGIDWREKDPKAGPRWLKKYGDPYTLVGDDPKSVASIAFGVSGAPESFIVDKKGVIRYKQIGPINAQNWQATLWPLVQELQAQ